MKSVTSVAVGALLALAIACGSGAKQSVTETPPRKDDARAELQRLDAEITAQMQQLDEKRPAPPVAACVENCAEPMATQAQAAKAPDDAATCPPPKTDTCTQSCTLKTSICENAAKICTLASDLGGNDAYANETCNRGLASCDAAKKRCCSCI